MNTNRRHFIVSMGALIFMTYIFTLRLTTTATANHTKSTTG